jgi:hypothetical protein
MLLRGEAVRFAVPIRPRRDFEDESLRIVGMAPTALRLELRRWGAIVSYGSMPTGISSGIDEEATQEKAYCG